MILPKNEDMVLRPITPYAASKMSGEGLSLAYAKTYELSVSTFRFFNIFGPWQRPDHEYAAVLPKWISKCMKGDEIEIFGDGRQTRDFSFVKQTVDTIVEIYLNNGSIRNTFNLASGSETAILDLVQKLLLILDSPNHEIVFCPKRPGDVYRHCGDVSKISELLGREMKTSLKLEDLSETVDWYRNIHGK
jgi:UDP-glucose 4-epimerase